jgi:hypothetical protein
MRRSSDLRTIDRGTCGSTGDIEFGIVRPGGVRTRAPVLGPLGYVLLLLGGRASHAPDVRPRTRHRCWRSTVRSLCRRGGLQRRPPSSAQAVAVPALPVPRPTSAGHCDSCPLLRAAGGRGACSGCPSDGRPDRAARVLDPYVVTPAFRDLGYDGSCAALVLGWKLPVSRNEALRRTLDLTGRERSAQLRVEQTGGRSPVSIVQPRL